jgi:hypothetical protein
VFVDVSKYEIERKWLLFLGIVGIREKGLPTRRVEKRNVRGENPGTKSKSKSKSKW